MIDIRDHIYGLYRRDLMERWLTGRPDICGYAKMLIAAQDAVSRREEPLIPEELSRALPSVTRLARLLVAQVEFEPVANQRGLPIPGGVRFPLFVFSPVIQFALLKSPDGLVQGKRVPALPASQKSMEAWLLTSMGLIRPSRPPLVPSAHTPMPTDPALISGKQEDEASYRKAEATEKHGEIKDAFAKRYNLSIAELAIWLLELRATDPVAFLLLLSREFSLALVHRPILLDFERAEHGRRRFLANFPHRQILAPLTVAELQRAFAMTRSLYSYSGASTGTVAVKGVVHAKMPGTRTIGSKVDRGEDIADHIVVEDGVGHVIDEAPLHADAIRRILNLRGRRAEDLDVDAVYKALEEGRTDWDTSKSARTRVGAHELIASTIAPAVMKRPGLKRGQRLVDRPLDIYYGVEASVIPSLAITELGLPLSRIKGRQEGEILASAMLTTVTGSALSGGQSTETRHKRAVVALDHYLPDYARLGSAGRFIATAWLERYRDQRLFQWLVTDRQLGSPKVEDSMDEEPDKRWLLALAIHLVKREFSRVYAKGKAAPHDLKMFADIASAVTVLSSDPILLAMLLESVEKGKAVTKDHRRADSNFAGKRGQVSLVDAGRRMFQLECRLRAVARNLDIEWSRATAPLSVAG